MTTNNFLPKIEIEIERIDPTVSLSELDTLDHMSRYKWASNYSSNKKILDAGCGNGYGTHYLSLHAESIVGVDIDQETIDKAKKNFFSKNVEFKKTNVNNLPFENDSFDLVISFEVIEHLSDYQTYFNEIKRVLKPGGVFIFSTPNKLFTDNNDLKFNPYHLKEYYHEEILRITEKNFKDCEIFGQKYNSEIIEISKSVEQKWSKALNFIKKIDVVNMRSLFSKTSEAKITKAVKRIIGGSDYNNVTKIGLPVEKFAEKELPLITNFVIKCIK
jgi:2-polyprenyl-3-methyl-5-hydroxy-6-metoxy-1,4-benzoquinol methylase